MIDFFKLKPGTLVKVSEKTTYNDLNHGLLISTNDKKLRNLIEGSVLLFCGISTSNDLELTCGIHFMHKNMLLFNHMRKEDVNTCCDWLEIL